MVSILFTLDGNDVIAALSFGASRTLILVISVIGIMIAEQFNLLVKKINPVGTFQLARFCFIMLFGTALLTAIFTTKKLYLDIYTLILIFFIAVQAIWLKVFFRFPKLKHAFPTSPQAHQSVLSNSNVGYAMKTEFLLQQYERYRYAMNLNFAISLVNIAFVALVISSYISPENASMEFVGESIVVISAILVLEIFKTLPYQINVTIHDQKTMKDDKSKRWTLPSLSQTAPVNESNSSQNRWTLPPKAREGNRNSKLLSPQSLTHASIISEKSWTLPTNKAEGAVVARSPKMVVPKTRESGRFIDRSSFLSNTRPEKSSMAPDRSSKLLKSKLERISMTPNLPGQKVRVEALNFGEAKNMVKGEPTFINHSADVIKSADNAVGIQISPFPGANNAVSTGIQRISISPTSVTTEDLPKRVKLTARSGGRPTSSRVGDTSRTSFLPTTPSLENFFTLVSQFESWDHLYPEADAKSIVIPENDEIDGRPGNGMIKTFGEEQCDEVVAVAEAPTEIGLSMTKSQAVSAANSMDDLKE